MAILVGFSLGGEMPEFYQPEKLEFLKNTIDDNRGLYKNMLVGMLIILILDVFVFTLYKYFKEDNKKVALLSGGLRVVYTLIFGFATFYLTKNLYLSEISIHIYSFTFLAVR